MRHIIILTMAVLLSLLMAGLTACGSKSGTSTSIDTSTTTTVTNMTIAPANKQVTISWAGSTTASGGTYTIYWSNSPGVNKKNGNKIANVTSPYIHTGLSDGTMYYYVITATTSAVEGAESLEISAAPQASVPAKPTGTIISPMDSKVQITITRSSAKNIKYNLYWSTGTDVSNPAKIANDFGSGATFIHYGLTNGIPYFYSVTAETEEGESPRSKTLLAQPEADIAAVNYVANVSAPQLAAPNGISATPGNQQVTLTWNMPATPTKLVPTIFDPLATPTVVPLSISSYNIYYSADISINDVSKAQKLPPISVTSKTKLPLSFVHNSNLVNNTTYYYVITAVADKDANGNPLVNSAGIPLSFESRFASQISVVPEAAAPAAPSGFSATSGAQQVSLVWNKDSNANAYYKIYASVSMPANSEDLVNNTSPIAITFNNSFIHTGLAFGTTYYYTVTSVADTESAPSSLVAVAM